MPKSFHATPASLADTIISTFSGEDQPTQNQVEAEVDDHLGLRTYRHLSDDRTSIVNSVLNRIVISMGSAEVLEAHDDHKPWLSRMEDENRPYWTRLRDWMLRGLELPPSVVNEVDRSTDTAIGRLEDPKRPGKWDRRGMVVGHVQSGKTTHYTALAAKALDSGYRVIIVLAGMHNNLRSQTHSRIDRDLIGRSSRDDSSKNRPIGARAFAVRAGHNDEDIIPRITTVTTSDDDGDFVTRDSTKFFSEITDTNALVMVVKKNGHILRRLGEWLRQMMDSGPPGQPTFRHSVLIIDDEADQASMNTAKSDDDPTAINRLIRKLLVSVDRVGYVAYTATPYANVFASLDVDEKDAKKYGDDLFPKSFIVNLKAPSNYIGPEEVFGNPGDPDMGVEPQPALPMHVDLKDTDPWLLAKHKNGAKPGPMPESLKEAIRLFVLACCVRVCRGDKRKHNSMLIHVTRFVSVQGAVHQQVANYLQQLLDLWESGSDTRRADEKSAYESVYRDQLIGRGKAFRDHPSLRDGGNFVGEYPPFDDLEDLIGGALARIKPLRINGESSDILAYEKHESDGFWTIAIGGAKLSRGLTLEGLSVSYFMRTSRAFDTLMQMARWFGYRPRYLDLCRTYTSSKLAKSFREITLATTELRRSFDEMSMLECEPREFGLKVRTPSDGLIITAANKIRSGESIMVRFSNSALQSLELPRDNDAADRNRAAADELIRDLRPRSASTPDARKGVRVWPRVTSSRVLQFFEGFDALATEAYTSRSARLRQYISKQVEDHEELTTWTVALVGNAPGTKASRDLNDASVDIGGVRTLLRMRSRDTELDEANRYRMRAILSPRDEALDFSTDALDRMREKRRRDGKSNHLPGELLRRERPSTRGLLLIYPILPQSGSPDGFTSPSAWLPGVVVSLPSSETAKPLSYRANEVFQRMLLRNKMDDPDE